MEHLSRKTVMRAYKRVGEAFNAQTVFHIDDVFYTSVEMPLVVECLTGKWYIAQVMGEECDYEDYIEGAITNSYPLRDAIVEVVIKPYYPYIPSGIVDAFTFKSYKSIQCGSTWIQVVRFCEKYIAEKGFERKI